MHCKSSLNTRFQTFPMVHYAASNIKQRCDDHSPHYHTIAVPRYEQESHSDNTPVKSIITEFFCACRCCCNTWPDVLLAAVIGRWWLLAALGLQISLRKSAISHRRFLQLRPCSRKCHQKPVIAKYSISCLWSKGTISKHFHLIWVFNWLTG